MAACRLSNTSSTTGIFRLQLSSYVFVFPEFSLLKKHGKKKNEEVLLAQALKSIKKDRKRANFYFPFSID
jgi:hypothetical protein